ncbi:MAG: helix-turn-helix transcriptional regulator [Acidobacteria bacterium]|nr:helix-turn-helix transcriptional regulator [Acidobacteriota bacterium]MBI1982939.1 helix-turn-helix transcriptional regulator [Acidobacteriota bacterium]
MQTPAIGWEDKLATIDPPTNAEGVQDWPFDPAFPIDIRFFASNGSHGIRTVRHDHYELVYGWSSTAIFQIQDRYFELRRGDLLVIGSSLYHGLVRRPRFQTKFVALLFRPDLVYDGPGDERCEYLLPFLCQDAQFPHLIPRATGIPAQVFELIHRIRAELPATSNRSRLAVKTYLKMILILLLNHYAAHLGSREPIERRELALERLRPLFKLLEAHYDQPTHVQDAARVCAMSCSHFMWFFKQVTGLSFVTYLNRFRIAKAQALLVSTEHSISEVSNEMGFCNQSYFGMLFHKLVGMSPLAYRRQFGESRRERGAGSMRIMGGTNSQADIPADPN